jgi:hypothetical protein
MNLCHNVNPSSCECTAVHFVFVIYVMTTEYVYRGDHLMRCLLHIFAFFSSPRCPHVGRREHSDRRTCRDELQCCCNQCCHRGRLPRRRHESAGHRLRHPEHELGRRRRDDGGCRCGRAKHHRSAPVRCGGRLTPLGGVGGSDATARSYARSNVRSNVSTCTRLF